MSQSARIVRSLTLRLVAIGLGLAAALLVAEGVLRLFGLAPTEGVATVTARQYQVIPGIFSPNQRVADRSIPQLPYHVSIDSLGYRGSDFATHKTPGEFRILVSGDSFVYGNWVDDAETLPAQLDRKLQPRCPSIAVINGGLGGSTIVDQARLIERGLTLDPDLVILVFSENWS